MKIKIRLIRIEAVVFYFIYTVGTKLIFLKTIFTADPIFAYLLQAITTAIFAFIFLCIFDNDKFFLFAKTIENKARNKEKKLEKKYLHLGKILAVSIIEIISGPLLGALAMHFLLKKYKMRYLLLVILGLISGALWLFFIRSGTFHFR